MIKEILSRQNEEIKSVAKLKSKKERISQRKFIAQGFRTFKTISENIVPDAVYCLENMLTKAKEIANEDNITLVSSQVMEKISETKTPSGLLGVFSIPKELESNKLTSGIVLDNISDPGNMGTLIRTCAAMGYKSVVKIEGADPWSPKVVQASAGNISKVDIFAWNWEKLIENKKNFKLTALVISDGKTPNEIDFQNSLLIIGSEAHGIDQQWLKICDQKLTLQMPGNTESLNAAVAGSIAIYLSKIYPN